MATYAQNFNVANTETVPDATEFGVGAKILNNQLASTATGDGGAGWNQAATADHLARAYLISGHNYYQIGVRGSQANAMMWNGTGTSYTVEVVGTTATLYRTASGAMTNLGSATGSLNQTWELSALGSTITVKAGGTPVIEVSNTVVTTGTWTSLKAEAANTTTGYADDLYVEDVTEDTTVIRLRAAGTATSATAAVTAVNPAVPSGATTGDLSVLTVWAKPYGTTITTPSGWTKVGEQTNGTTAAGTDTGSTKVAVYVRESASTGAIGNIAQSGADSMGAVINTYAKDAAKSWDFSSYTDGGDTANGANYSATGAAGISVDAGDWVLQSTAVNGDVGTQSAQAIGGMSGATLGTYVVRQSADVTTGTDSHGEIGDVPVASGSSSAAPTFTYTNASSGSGTTIWLRLRQVTGGTNAAAENAAATVTANDSTATVSTAPESAAATLTANDAAASVKPAAESAALAVSALDATTTASGNAPAESATLAVTALDATTTSSGNAPAEAAGLTVSALDATVSTASATNAPAESAGATVSAHDAGISASVSAEHATLTVAALDATVSTSAATNASAEAASVTVAADSANPSVAASSESAAVTVAALDATVSTSAAGSANAEAAAASVEALDATGKITGSAEPSTLTVSALDATVSTSAATNAPADVGTVGMAALDATVRVTTGAEVATVSLTSDTAAASVGAMAQVAGITVSASDAAAAIRAAAEVVELALAALDTEPSTYRGRATAGTLTAPRTGTGTPTGPRAGAGTLTIPRATGGTLT